MTEWIYPFQGRYQSGCFRQNFVWRRDNVYIMDNHRAALWCWMQHVQQTRDFALLHIGRHTDTLYSNIETWTKRCPEVRQMSIKSYLEFPCTQEKTSDVPLFSWANYLSIFLERYGKHLIDGYYATHNYGDDPGHDRFQPLPPWKLPGIIAGWIDSCNAPVIVNVDLDYFVYEKSSGSVSPFFLNDYFGDVFLAIRKKLAQKKICVLTIALSPEYAGGWPLAEDLCDRACSALGVDFRLPAPEAK